MKRKTTLFALLVLFASVLFAAPVDPEKAREMAVLFWNSKAELNKNVTLKLVDDAPSKAGAVKDNTVSKVPEQYYLFSAGDNGGFVIISGDDRLSPVVGYSDRGFAGEMPPALAEWLDEYSEYVDDVRSGIVMPVKAAAAAPGDKIEPMLQTSWNQSAPYNNYCPEVNGQKTPTGCTATAMAQIMKFHEWPLTPKANVIWKNNITGVSETLYLTSHTYDWSKMLPHYRNGYTAEQADAVATLMVDVGKAIDSNYALAGTGSSEVSASYALVNVFDYSPDATIVRRSEYTDEEFVAIIRENLEARQPLLYTGHSQSYGSGHAFVCDGIDENNMLHIDWGWDGTYNGYFDMTYMTPEGTGIGGGEGSYNVGQAIIANIRPRVDGEPDEEGVPTVYMMNVVDVRAASNPATLYEQSVGYNANSEATVRIAAGLLNWSHSSVGLSMVIAFEKDGKLVSETLIGDRQAMAYNSSFGYYIKLSLSNDPASEIYFEKGKYRVLLCYSDDEDNLYLARGAENGLELEVGDSYVTIRKELPEIELSSVSYHKTPQMKGDGLAFDAKFKTTNGKSATVLLVPVINKLQDNGTYKRSYLTSEAELIQVYDDRDIMATFETSYAFPEDGEYYISFMYNLKNEFIDRTMDVDNANLFDIAGKSSDIIIKSQFDGATPSTTAISATSVNWGESLEVKATVKNITTTSDSFTGILAIVIEENSTKKSYVLAKESVEGLAKNAKVELSYKAPDYAPIVVPGYYTAYICEVKNGKLEKIKQSATTCDFAIGTGASNLVYADARMVINDGSNVRQGVPFDLKVSLNTVGDSFDGYIRVQVTNGLTKYVESDYIPVSLNGDNAVDVIVPCTCSEKTILGRYRMNINYYNSKKGKIGTVSNNTIEYPDNGYFWVADVTAIDELHDGESGVAAGEGCIDVIADDAVVTVYTLDGRTVYRGAAATVTVEKGLYVVTVAVPGKAVETTKILVK